MPAEDVLSLLGHSINYRNVLGDESNNALRNAETARQNTVENYYKGLKAILDEAAGLRAAAKEKREANGLNRSAPYEVDGKMYIDWTDGMGSVVKREELGKATKNDQAKRLLKLPDGTLQFFGPNDQIPKGATPTGASDGSLTANQQFNQQMKLAGLDQIFSTGKDANGEDIEDPAQLSGYAEIYNSTNPTYQWVSIPGTDKTWINKDARWVKLPKDPAAIMKMPDDTVVSRDDDTGEEITLADIKATAKEAKSTPAAVLKFLGLIK